MVGIEVDMERVVAFVRERLLGLALDSAQGQIVGVVRALLGLAGGQGDALEALGARVSAAATAHLEAGRLQLSRAVEEDRHDADRATLLAEARSNLQLFVANGAVSHAERSFGYLHLYLTDVALGNRRDAERDLRDAHGEAARAALDVEASPFTKPEWVKRDLVAYLNALGEMRRQVLGDSARSAPTFIGHDVDADRLGAHDWRSWAYGYANRPAQSRTGAGSQLELAARVDVDDIGQLARTLDLIDAGAAVHVRFLDEWLTAHQLP